MFWNISGSTKFLERRGDEMKDLLFVTSLLGIVLLGAILLGGANQTNSLNGFINPGDYEMVLNFEEPVQIEKVGESVSITVVDEFSLEGQKSLKIENRTSGWEGAEIDLTKDWQVFNSANFQITTHIYQTSPDPQLFRIVAYIKDSKGERFETITEKVVMPNYWKEINKEFKFCFNEPVDKFSLRTVTPLESNFTYYIDNFQILGANKVERAGAISKTSFEDRQHSWEPRGDGVSISLTNKVFHSGEYSLAVEGRKNNWNGAQINLAKTLKPGTSYDFDIYVYQDTREDQLITLTMQRKYASDANTNYDTILWQIKVPSNTWTQLTGSYTVKSGAVVEELIFYVESPNPTLSFYLDDFSMTDNSIPLYEPEWEIIDLKDKYKDNFDIGVAIPYKVLVNPLEMKMVENHFNSITAENEMKPESILMNLGSYDFSVADEYIEYAKEKGIKVRGHTLVWHSQTPEWFFKDEDGNLISKNELLSRMETYIHDVVGHFKGEVYAWDVVNEAIDPNQPDGYRRSLWYEIIGPEYIEYAFKFAHEADPKAKLFYNDYNTYEQKKRDYIYNMVKGLKAKGVPIDGIGMQMHIGIGTDLRQVEEAIKLFSSIPGIEIQITEIDMSVYTDQGSNYMSPPYEALVEQGYKYRELFHILKKYDDVISSVTFWGLKDDYSWKNQTRNDWPLLFDKDYQSKYAYWGIVKPAVLPIVPKSNAISQGTAIPYGMLDDDYLFSKPIFIYDKNGEEKLNARIIWDENKLFVYGEVFNETSDEEDGVAIFIDPNNAKTPYLQEDDIWVIIHPDWTVEKNKEDVEVEYFVSSGYKKYSFECSINLQKKLEKEQKIGFDIAIIDGENIYSWSDNTNQQKSQTINYGVLTLEGASVGKAKYGTPVIDAEIDEVWSQSEEYITETIVLGSSNNAKANFRVLWDENALYVLAIVEDSVLNKENTNAWEQDSLEIFIDENNNKTGFYENDDAQYRVIYVNTPSFGTGGSAANFKAATKIIESGYIVEAAISWKFISPTGGEVVGFDVQVNDAGATGSRVGITTWNDPTGNNYQSTVNFGNIILEK